MATKKETKRRFLKTAPRPLFVLYPELELQDRIRRAGGRDFQFQNVYEWEMLHEALREAPPAALVVVDPYETGNGRKPLSGQLEKLMKTFPSTTVLAMMEVRPERGDDLRTLSSWGITDIITLGEDDTQEGIARRLDAAQGRPLQRLLQRSLPEDVSGHARSIVVAAAEVAASGGQGRELAELLHLSMRTLLRWCERAELPPPRRLLAWMRILLAAELLDDPGRTVLSVAFACGYASDSSLRRALADFLKRSPTELRDEGAFNVASAAFLHELQLVKEGKMVARRKSVPASEKK